jgi:hypothetical protein
LSGWGELAAAYRTTSSFQGTPVAWLGGSLLLRLGEFTLGFSSILPWPRRVAADRSGLYITAFPLFRPFNPPLFVPWADVSFHEVRSHTSLPVRVRFRRAPTAYLVISERLASDITLAAGGSFPGVSVA